jgi:hypothetical protein
MPSKRGGRSSVRVSSGGHLALALGLFCVSYWLFRSGMDYVALAVSAFSVVIVPLLASVERLEFDGTLLRRRGPVAFLKKAWGFPPLEMSVPEIERVETSALRTLRRGGRVYY